MSGSTPSVEDAAQELQIKMKRLQEEGLEAVSARLVHASPYHPVRLIRLSFILIVPMAALVTIGCLVAPLALQGEPLRWLQLIDQASPLGLPILGAVVCAVSGITSFILKKAENLLGRDYPLLPDEQIQYDAWLLELQAISLTAKQPTQTNENKLTPKPAVTRKKVNNATLLQTPFGPPLGPLHSAEEIEPNSDGAQQFDFNTIDQPWLAETLQNAKELEAHYPIQVTLDYSIGRDIPFSMTIERATLGVVNQAILDFVQFLGSIPTPPKAIISLRNMTHVDKQLSLTVVTAMDAHCQAEADVNQIGSEIHIHFVTPDSYWKRFPYLPTHLL